MPRTLEQLDALLDVRTRLDASRRRLLEGNLVGPERQFEHERLVELSRKELELEAAGEPRPAPASDAAELSPAEARDRAAAIRARPEFWNSGRLNERGEPVITREAHEQLKRQLVEYDARAGEPAETEV